MSILNGFWRVLALALTLFGIFWLPKDIEDWTTAAEPWKRWVSMIDQNTALWLFAFTSLALVFIVELRAFQRSRLRHNQESDERQKRLEKLGSEMTTLLAKWDAHERKGLSMMDIDTEFAICVEAAKSLGISTPGEAASTQANRVFLREVGRRLSAGQIVHAMDKAQALSITVKDGDSPHRLPPSSES